jgi:hypothetical protein
MTGRYSRQVQLGKEATAGTAVAATVQWAGEGVPDEGIDLRHYNYADGSIVGNNQTYIAGYAGTIALEPTPANFNHLPLLFDMGIDEVAGVQDGAGTAYVYSYDIPELTFNALRTATIEAGNDQQMKEMAYCFCESINLTGAPGEPVMMSAQVRGRQWSTTTVTTLATETGVRPIIFSTGALYTDDAFGNWGNTALASTLYGFSLDIDTGIVAKGTAANNLTFDFPARTGFEAMLEVTFEYNAAAVLEEADWRAETPRYLRLLFLDSVAVATPGAYTYKQLQIDLYGKWMSFDPLTDDDGNELIVGHLKCMYDATNTVAGNITVVNELADIWA